MSEAIVAPTPTTATTPVLQRMQGRVDAIDAGHVFGWAWHAERPTERLTIEAIYDGRVIATATADRARVDLRRNGIGDGSYAFDIQVDDNLPDLLQRLSIRAVASDAEAITLRIPSSDERAAEAAVAVPLARVLERMELLIAAQRQTQFGQREMTTRIDALAGEEGQIGLAVSQVASAQSDLATRVTSLEVFLSRFDVTLGGFDRSLKTLQKVGSSEVKPLVIMLATMLGFVTGAVLVMFLK
ncbi:MAG: hypothetical protein P0Y65_15785 [Candidatus Devosia phytovorans]|uniref:Uncharacterized protein n=1 Tax=Candidatus Devosia phytovorans TaxID=3121372 RepID=A0AAJ6AZZ1_9HYPH|nr:hypothetical protein [Devosia sp.]WEK03639.1 MAG: hypothetical protein P0Y65_15785 [Devosia sp.]